MLTECAFWDRGCSWQTVFSLLPPTICSLLENECPACKANNKCNLWLGIALRSKCVASDATNFAKIVYYKQSRIKVSVLAYIPSIFYMHKNITIN